MGKVYAIIVGVWLLALSANCDAGFLEDFKKRAVVEIKKIEKVVDAVDEYLSGESDDEDRAEK